MRQLWMRGLIALLLALAGCAGPSDHDAALGRWRLAAPAHYILRTSEDLRGQLCHQSVEVRDEQIVQILGNSCSQPSLWTVEWLFRQASAPPSPVEPCVRSVLGIGCICRQRASVSVGYDQRQGYPLRIHTAQVWRPAWGDLGFWRLLVDQGAIPNCTPPKAEAGWTITVRELRALP
jgi:hypothetical protein